MKFFLNKFSALVILSLALLSPLFAAESKTIGFAFHHDGKICALSEAYDPNNEWGINVEASQNILPDLLKVTKESWGQIEFLEQRKRISHLMIDEEQAHFLPVTLKMADNMDNITAAETAYNNFLAKYPVEDWRKEEQACCFRIEILPGDGTYKVRTSLIVLENGSLTAHVAKRVAKELKIILQDKPNLPMAALPFSFGNNTSYSGCANDIYSILSQQP